MKQGKTLTELATELERQAKAKKDFIAPSEKIVFKTDPILELSKKETEEKFNKVMSKIRLEKLGEYPLNELAEEQISGRLEIPVKYFDKMKKEAPGLLEYNVNHWLQEGSDKFMIRTMDGRARAILSGRYRPLDNFELAEAVLPEMSKMSVQVVSSEITEKHLYIKATTDRITAEVKKGDIVQAGIVISNSEVGCGSVKIEPMIYRLVCLNGMIQDDRSLRKYHVGRRGTLDELTEYFADETRQADDKAFWLKVRDIVRSALAEKIFTDGVEKMRRSLNNIIDVTPGEEIKIIEKVDKVYGLQNGEVNGILSFLIKGNDLNQFGLVNAITAESQLSKDYERATELERLGGQILELNGKSWSNFAHIA